MPTHNTKRAKLEKDAPRICEDGVKQLVTFFLAADLVGAHSPCIVDLGFLIALNEHKAGQPGAVYHAHVTFPLSTAKHFTEHIQDGMFQTMVNPVPASSSQRRKNI